MNRKTLYFVNRILLGLVMFIPGVLKLFVIGPDAVVDMLAGLGFPFSFVLAWLLIVGEIVAGVTILTRWNMHIGGWIGMIVLVVAGVSANLDSPSSLLTHLALASNYAFLIIAKRK